MSYSYLLQVRSCNKVFCTTSIDLLTVSFHGKARQLPNKMSNRCLLCLFNSLTIKAVCLKWGNWARMQLQACRFHIRKAEGDKVGSSPKRGHLNP